MNLSLALQNISKDATKNGFFVSDGKSQYITANDLLSELGLMAEESTCHVHDGGYWLEVTTPGLALGIRNITIRTELNPFGMAAFIEGFRQAAPVTYDMQADSESEFPAYAPWMKDKYHTGEGYLLKGKTPFEMGGKYAQRYFKAKAHK